MATRKNQQIAALCGDYIPADEVQRLRNDVRYDDAAIARAMGVPLQVYQNAVSAPAPVPMKPVNWTSSPAIGAAPYVLPAYVGITPTPYSHPWYPGYTYGAPIYAQPE
jgi:hypothetical protein